MADTIEIFGLKEQQERLDHLLMSNPDMEKKVQSIVRKVLLQARKSMEGKVQSIVGTGYKFSRGDIRNAYKAIRTSVYRQILGGNINILSRRRAGKRRNVEYVKKLKPGQRGGNRMARSQRTTDLMSYYGADRGFILRFINAGTSIRTSSIGNRGSIAPRNFFATLSQQTLETYAQNFEQYIDELIKKEFS